MRRFLHGRQSFITEALLRSSFILVLLIASCSPQKRLARFQRCYPELFDTTTTVDTIKIEIPKVDTFYSTWSTKDTVIFHDSIKNLTIKEYFYRDTVRIFYKSRPCTTIVQRQTQKIKTVEVEKGIDYEKILLYILGIFVLGFLIRVWK